MFGIIRPCRHRLPEPLRDAWWAHLCGMCLALRDDHGQFARVATNYDGLLISALVEAQTVAAQRKKAGRCALRGMRAADVSDGDGARLAASVSLMLASAKVSDHVVDGDGLYGRSVLRVGADRLAKRWAGKAERAGDQLGLSTGVLVDAVRRQADVESAIGPGGSVLTATEPTETATATAFAHTAVLAGRPGNVEPLADVGRRFGRIAHLLDAVDDLDADRASGAWNPLLATKTPHSEVRRLCADAASGVRSALAECEFADRSLVDALLDVELRHAVYRRFGHSSTCTSAQQPYPQQPYPQQPGQPQQPYPQQPQQYPSPYGQPGQYGPVTNVPPAQYEPPGYEPPPMPPKRGCWSWCCEAIECGECCDCCDCCDCACS